MEIEQLDYCERATSYARRVVAGEIPAGSFVVMACQRHLDDLDSNDFIFDAKAGNRICAFAEKLPHVKGRWKTKTIVLEDWQCFILCNIFGWIDVETGLRRFRKALVVIPRKNSKSTLAAVIGLYLAVLDDEPGAEVYSTATTREQAKISWGIAKSMVEKMGSFRQHFDIQPLAHSILVENTGSCFRPLSREADSLEGLNVHGGIIDELHAHRTRDVFDVVDEATGSRRQPLLFIISTEGEHSVGAFAEQVAYGQNVLRGNHVDQSYFCVYYAIDKDDDWTNEAAWYKANPNLGVSVFIEDMRLRCKQALVNSQSQSSFLMKRLNVRVGAYSTYFNLMSWHSLCKDEKIKMEDFKGQPCIITIDLASKRDLTTIVIVFRRGSRFYVFARHYLPEDAIDSSKPNYALYNGWIAENRITITPGNITDYEFLEVDLKELVSEYRPSRVGIDPNYNAGQFTTRMLSSGVPMIDIPHTVAQFSEPMKELDAMIVAGNIRHDGDPVLSWAIGNVVSKEDAKGNVYPKKLSEIKKIDPAVTLIANIGQQMRLKPSSIYATSPSM